MSDHESETVSIGSWKVMIVRDADDHLSLFISNEDGSEVFATGADVSERACWGERFTTETIEKIAAGVMGTPEETSDE
jgi:hypothetical protein